MGPEAGRPRVRQGRDCEPAGRDCADRLRLVSASAHVGTRRSHRDERGVRRGRVFRHGYVEQPQACLQGRLGQTERAFVSPREFRDRGRARDEQGALAIHAAQQQFPLSRRRRTLYDGHVWTAYPHQADRRQSHSRHSPPDVVPTNCSAMAKRRSGGRQASTNTPTPRSARVTTSGPMGSGRAGRSMGAPRVPGSITTPPS